MVLECDCGYLARGDDEEHLIADVRSHAWSMHHVELSAELVLQLAHEVDEGGPRA